MQPLLDILVCEPPALENFVVGLNGAALAAVKHWVEPHATTGLQHSLFLWGEAGSGCTHLAMAAARAGNTAHFLQAEHLDAKALSEHSLHPTKVCLDQVEKLPPATHSEWFRYLREADTGAMSLLITSHAPPNQLSLPPEMTSRMGKMQIHHLARLSDEEKMAALHFHAKRRGMTVEPTVLQYFLQHINRDMRMLTALITTFDIWCLQQKCAPTLPMARRMLAAKRDDYPEALVG